VAADDGVDTALTGAVIPSTSLSANSPLVIVQNLEDCISAAQEVMNSARCLRHKAEHAKLLITASEHLRRCLETAIRLHETLLEQSADRAVS
jgi:hypothetical protein